MNLVLIGYRGTGKSEVGRRLAKSLGMSLVGMDAEIVRRAGLTIPEIVARHGWPRFRDLESEEARRLAGRDHLVIDTGGGVIERPENIQVLQSNALVFWLQAKVATIVSRIQRGTDRPALTEGKSFTEEVAEVLERRAPKYRSAAHYEIATDQLTPDQVAETIIRFWKTGTGRSAP